MSAARWFWLITALVNAAGIWRWLTMPGIELFWLIVWSISFIVCFEAFISNRAVTGERKHHGNHK